MEHKNTWVRSLFERYEQNSTFRAKAFNIGKLVVTSQRRAFLRKVEFSLYRLRCHDHVFFCGFNCTTYIANFILSWVWLSELVRERRSWACCWVINHEISSLSYGEKHACSVHELTRA